MHENLSLDRLILHFDVQFIRLPGFVAVMPDHHGQRFRLNQVSFRRRDFLNRVQAPPERFRQGHAARFIRGERVDLLFGRIMHRLAHRFAVCVHELKRRMRQRDGLARFLINLQRADDARQVVGVDLSGVVGVDPLQLGVKCRAALGVRPRL